MSSIDSPGCVLVLQLSIALPYYDLSFFVNEREELEFHDFKNMVYDENQCIGALFNLGKLLVLRQTIHLLEGLIPRHILAPKENAKDLYHTYNMDTELGFLIGNSSLTAMQHLAELHVKTNYYSPDPLTGKTGA